LFEYTNPLLYMSRLRPGSIRPPSKLESEESDDLFTQEGAVSEACRDEADSGEAKEVDRKRGE
jgi:hypothetical protein